MPAELTPMMRQYMEVKEKYKDCILFYRLGDFYEMFFEDALLASRELEIVLTGRDCGLEERAPMCGVPYHAVEIYASKLIEKGYKVAICDQIEDASQAKGLVKRAVTRILTPGMVYDPDTLDAAISNYLCSFDTHHVAFLEPTTGELFFYKIKSESEKQKIIILDN